MLGSLQTQFWQIRDYLSPVLLSSKFKESGRLTPDEFVAAGDYLCYKFPTWSWEAGEPSKRRDYLPADKQYLVSRNVPCLRRVSQLAYNGEQDEDSETMLSFALEAEAEGADDAEGEEWVATHTAAGQPPKNAEAPEIGDIPDLDAPSSSLSEQLAKTSLAEHDNGVAADEDKMPDMDDIPDMSDDEGEEMGGGLVEEEDDAALKPTAPSAGASAGAGSSNLLSVRTYDCSITYDKYYQTPRMWLLGYDESRHPLPPPSALEDVSAAHAHKTVTIEPFPHSSLSMASVHPCKHASVMKRVVERMDGAVRAAQLQARSAEGGANSAAAGKDGAKDKEKKGKWGLPSLGGKKEKAAEDPAAAPEGQEQPEGLRVDQYLVVFLKFMSSIVPTIEVDATNSI